MKNIDREYYYIDIDITNLKIVKWGVSNTATLTGDTNDKNIHRIFLTRGQYNKLLGRI
ncbi:MAG TPA: hypothetical protein PKH06_02780 [Candidatus Dojkabacteria bacterium]|nr:hypothetical protein [Candidatus Dojkabacteria bacterium]